MNRIFQPLGITIAAVLAMMLSACTPAQSPAPTPTPQATSKPVAATPAPQVTAKPAPKSLEKIKITTPSASATNLPLYFAQEKGYFAEEGLDAEVFALQSAMQVPALLNGEIDYSALVGESIRVALLGEPIRLLWVMTDKVPWTIVLAPGLTSAQQIEGKAWGIVGAAAPKYAAREVMKYFKLDQSKITFVTLDPSGGALAPLRSGSIAAANVTMPETKMAADAGLKLLINTGDVMETPTNGLSTSLKKIQQNPDQVKRVLRAITRAMDYMKSHKDEAAQLITTRFSLEKQMAQEVVEDEMRRWSRDGTVSDRGLQTQVDILGADQQFPVKDLTVEQVKKTIDYTFLKEAQKELGLPR